MPGPDITFGKPWAAKGEERERNFLTPMAWVDGADGGVLFVFVGRYKYGQCDSKWMAVKDWDEWVSMNRCLPVDTDAIAAKFDAAMDRLGEDMAAEATAPRNSEPGLSEILKQ